MTETEGQTRPVSFQRAESWSPRPHSVSIYLVLECYDGESLGVPWAAIFLNQNDAGEGSISLFLLFHVHRILHMEQKKMGNNFCPCCFRSGEPGPNFWTLVYIIWLSCLLHYLHVKLYFTTGVLPRHQVRGIVNIGNLYCRRLSGSKRVVLSSSYFLHLILYTINISDPSYYLFPQIGVKILTFCLFPWKMLSNSIIMTPIKT